MARRRLGNRVFARPAPKAMIWIALGIVETTIASAVGTLFGSLNAASLGLRPFTIVRTHALLSILTDQVAGSEYVQGAFGMQVVTDSASAAGAASIPMPLTEANADFFVYQPFMNQFQILSSVGAFERTGQGSFYEIDSKAMRKVGVDDDVVLTIENRTNGYNAGLEGRMLVKIH